MRALTSSLLSAATRFSRQMATGCGAARHFLDAAAAAGGFARPVAGAAQHAGKDIGMPVDHIGVGITPRRDHADIFGHRRVRGTGPLAIHDLVKVIGILDVGGLHARRWTAILHAAHRRVPGRFIHRWTAHVADRFPNDLPLMRPTSDGYLQLWMYVRWSVCSFSLFRPHARETIRSASSIPAILTGTGKEQKGGAARFRPFMTRQRLFCSAARVWKGAWSQCVIVQDPRWR